MEYFLLLKIGKLLLFLLTKWTKEYILYYYIYVKLLNRQKDKMVMEIRLVITCSVGRVDWLQTPWGKFQIQWKYSTDWHHHQKPFDYRYESLYLALFYFTDLYVYLYASPTLFWTVVIHFRIRKYEICKLVFFSRLSCLFGVPWDSIWILGYISQIL